MSSNPALADLVSRKVEEVNAKMRAKYGDALANYFFNGVFDPVLREIGYDGSEVPRDEFGGLADLVEEPRTLADATQNLKSKGT